MNERDIFIEALQQTDAVRRSAFLDGVCGQDAKLRERIEVLLGREDENRSFLEQPAAEIVATAEPPPPAEKPGTMIGPYKLIEQIGEGGMGVVYLAEQTEPVRRKVALKVIKPGMDSKQVVSRFEAERQALAMMDHPSIARVFDGGSTKSGRPYFVMELVNGMPVTDYCDRYRFTTDQRLGLFIQVCQAVQHAHQKGIIHRDLKPSNILVTRLDGRAVPKVIDFGVAKAISGQLTDRSTVTHFSQMIGTPLYMSPEQADQGSQDIDTRSDVYSLGVLLYELLTGTTPFDRERMKEVSYDEVRRIIQEEEPPRPSSRLSTLDAALDTVAEKRQTDPRKLSRRLSGELDWIVLKPLEKDRARRYESATDLAKDIQRYLNDEAVEACPPSTAYRLRKIMRRHRGKLATIALVAAVFVMATVVSTCLGAWAVRAEAVARTERAEALDAKALAEEAEQLAQRQERLAKQQRDTAEHNLYVSNVRLAGYDGKAGNTSRMVGMLNSVIPEPGHPDFRGWEWYYLFSQCHKERFAFPLYEGWFSIAWSPDGRRLAAANRLGLVDIWDVTTGQRKASLKGYPGGRIHSLSWSPDGKCLAAGGHRRAVVIWDIPTGKKVLSLHGHTAELRRVAWNPDSRRIASGGEDGTIRIWDAHSGKQLSLLVGTNGPVWALQWHPDGERLLAATGPWAECRLKIWDTTDGDEIVNWQSQSIHVTLSPDGSHVAWGDMRITDLKTRKSVSSFFIDRPAPTAWSPGGEQLASVMRDGVIKIWDAETGEETVSMAGHASRVTDLIWSSDERLLASADVGGAVKVWDTSTLQGGLTVLKLDRVALSVAFSPDDRHLLVGALHGMLKIWDVQSAEETLAVQQFGLSQIRCIAWCPDGKRFAARLGKDIAICDATTGEQVLPLLESEDEARSLAWSPDGKLLAIGLKNRRLGDTISRVKLWDANTGKELNSSAYIFGMGDSVAWSPDGRRLAAAGRTGRTGFFRVWNSALREEIVVTEEGLSLVWSSNGERLALGDEFGRIKIFDTTTWDKIHVLDGHQGHVPTLAWHPSMPRLASADDHGTIIIWDTSTARELCSLEGHSGRVEQITWSSDGLRLASASHDGTVRIWDTSVAVRSLESHGDLRAQVSLLARKEQYQEAIAPLRRLCKLYPEEAELKTQLERIQWLRATQLARDGQRKEAVAIFKRLTSETSDLPDYRLQLAYILFEAERYDEAIHMLRKLIGASPQTPEYADELAFSYEYKATELCRSGRFEEAVAILVNLAREFPERPDFRAELAYQTVKANRLEETMATLEKIAEACSHWPDYRLELARRLVGNLESAMAATIFEQLVNEFPDVPEYSKELAALRKLSQTTDTSQAASEEGNDQSPESKPDSD